MYGKRFLIISTLVFVLLPIFSCLDQEVESFTVIEAKRLLAGPLGTKTWSIERENQEITFSILTANPSAILEGIDGDTTFVNLDFSLSQSSIGTFTDTLFFVGVNSDANNFLGNVNLVQSISSLKIKLVTENGTELNLVSK